MKRGTIIEKENMQTYTDIFWCFCAFALFIFITYQIHGGVYDTLSNARIGGVYSFLYLQPLTGEYQRHIVKVLKIRKLDKEELDSLNCFSLYRRWDVEFYRTATLVTCENEDGAIRNFYAERATNCMRVRLPFLYKFWKLVVSPCPVRV